MKKTLLLLSAFLLLSIFGIREANAQNLDSLYSVWQDKSQPDLTEVMAEALHVYAKEHQYPKASTSGYNIQGLANWIHGNYPYELHYSLRFHPVSKKSSVLEKESGITLYKSVKLKKS